MFSKYRCVWISFPRNGFLSTMEQLFSVSRSKMKQVQAIPFQKREKKKGDNYLCGKRSVCSLQMSFLTKRTLTPQYAGVIRPLVSGELITAH